MTKQCSYFTKGKEYQEAQRATASGPPKPVNYTRRQPTPVNTPYHYTLVNYGIPLQHQPQQYLTFASYSPSYHHYNTYDNPQTSFSYNNRPNNQPYMVTHPPTPPQMQNQHPALPPPPPSTQPQQQQVKIEPVSQPNQTTINNPTSTFGMILAITRGSNEDHDNKRQRKEHMRQVHHLTTEGPHKNS